MRPRLFTPWAVVPAVVVLLLLIALPVLAYTDTGLERSVRGKLGLLDKGCQPHTKESPGWREAQPLPDARDEPRSVAVEGQIYLAGGINAITDYGKPSTVPGVKEHVAVTSLRSFTRFDPRTGTYTELAPMPEALNHLGLVTYRGDVYVVGGHGKALNGEDPKAGFYRFSPDQNRWTRLAPMPTARGAVAAGVVGDRLYVAGGMTRGHAVTTVEAYDFGDRRWHKVADLPAPREHIAGTVLDGRFYIIGGRGPFDDALKDVTRYDPSRDRWEPVADLPLGTGGAQAVTYRGAILAMGGGSDRARTVTGVVQRFDPHTGSWTQLAGMPTPRHGFAASVLGSRIYTLGGSPCALFAASDIVEVFSPPAGH